MTDVTYAIISTDGTHSWVGRAYPPTDGELEAIHNTLVQRQIAADYCKVIGNYWTKTPLTIEAIQSIGVAHDSTGFDKFMEKRNAYLSCV